MIMLFTLLIITLDSSVSLFIEKRNQKFQNSLKDDFKTALIPTMIFSILSSLFIYSYFEHINPEIIKSKLIEEEIALNSESNFEEFKKIEGNEFKTREEFKKLGMENARIWLSAFNMSIMWLALSTFWSFINGIFLCVIFRISSKGI